MTDPGQTQTQQTPTAASLELPANARALLDAVVAISSDLDLHSVLKRIVVSACEITGARYGALGVIGHGGGLVDFVTHGVSDEVHAAIGDLPRGHGILGLLIDHPEPLRLHRLQEHPKSYGFPPHHPPMERFLGVPVRIRGTVFGNLYLTEKDGGGDFTDQDEQLVSALASAAGFVIENARDYAQSERRRQWLEATAQINEALQPPVRLDDALRQIAIGARRVSDAAAVAVVRRAARESGHEVAAWDGRRIEDLATLARTLETHITAAEAEVETNVMVIPQGAERTIVLVPLRAHLAPDGVLLVVLDAGRGSLESDEAELLASFADQAALALDRAQAISDRQELMLVSDRDRIARDLHDLVIQRLFATGLALQGARRIALNEEVKERLDAAVADLDVTIRDIRSTIFHLQEPGRRGLRAEVATLAREAAESLGFRPTLELVGPIDSAVPDEVRPDLTAVLREALSNAVRHAEAHHVAVAVPVDARQVSVTSCPCAPTCAGW